MKKILNICFILLAVILINTNVTSAESNKSGEIIMSVSLQSLNFNNANVGTTQTIQITISNAAGSGESLLIYPFPLNSPFSFSPAGIRAIAPGTSQSFDLTFSPAAAGPSSGTWTIINNSTNLPQSLQLNVSGSGSGAAVNNTASIIMSVNPKDKDFGDVWTGNGASFTFMISNSANSTAPLIISQDPASILPFKTDMFGTINIAPGQTKNVIINFNPINVQTYNKSWIIINNSTNENNRFVVTLRGRGSI